LSDLGVKLRKLVDDFSKEAGDAGEE
jgi:hypothetical protein